MEGELHLRLDLGEPKLNVTHLAVFQVGVDFLVEDQGLCLVRIHVGDDVLRREVEPVDPLEAFCKEGLDPAHVSGLRKNRQKFWVRKKVEPRKGRPLGVEVIVQRL